VGLDLINRIGAAYMEGKASIGNPMDLGNSEPLASLASSDFKSEHLQRGREFHHPFDPVGQGVFVVRDENWRKFSVFKTENYWKGVMKFIAPLLIDFS
jgi:hypothetical protein